VFGDFHENLLRRHKFCCIGNFTWGPKYLLPLPESLNRHWKPWLRPKLFCC